MCPSEWDPGADKTKNKYELMMSVQIAGFGY